MEGKEPPCFIRLFSGHMMIHSGKRDTPSSRRWRLYILRNELPLEAYLWEIPAECRNLRSRASFLLVDCEQSVLYVWHGAKSSLQTKQRVMDMTNWIIHRYDVTCSTDCTGVHSCFSLGRYGRSLMLNVMIIMSVILPIFA